MCWSYLLLLALHYFSAIAAQCGVPAGLTKIVGGQSVPNLRYPWFVALVSPSSLSTMSVSCGGSLITSRHVVTAAHCFPRDQSGRPEEMYRVVFELVDRCNNPNVPNSAISKVDINPGYNPQTLGGDVAVVTLERSVPYTPICLPPRNSMRIGEAIIIGFGSTLVKSTYPCTMQEARVNIYTKGQCARSGLAQEYSTIPGTICAGIRRGGVDSCDGDSGGPIQTVGPDGLFTIQGIVSFGEGCARRNLPGVYTQVSAYRDFIDGIVSGRIQTTTNPCVNCGSPPSRFYVERKSEPYTQRVPVVLGAALLVVAVGLLASRLLRGHSPLWRPSFRGSDSTSRIRTSTRPAATTSTHEGRSSPTHSIPSRTSSLPAGIRMETSTILDGTNPQPTGITSIPMR